MRASGFTAHWHLSRPAETERLGAASLRIVTAWWEGVARYLFRRAVMASLRELDDRVLGDIGLERSQIEAVVRDFMTAPDRAGV